MPSIKQVIVQPTSLCNLDCTYCYLPNRLDAARMDHETLATTIKRVLESELVQEDVEFVWHAGEPLLAGIEFYERVVGLIERYNTRGVLVRNAIQTNATRVTDDWCSFFRSSGFSVGVSVDGPATLNDRHRLTRTGKGTHATTMRGVRLLQAHGIDVGAICVLTRDSLRYADEIYAFFDDAGFSNVGFNVEEVENAHLQTSLDLQQGENKEIVQEFRAFASRLYDLWRVDPRRLPIREFSDMLFSIYGAMRDPTYAREPAEAMPLSIVTVQKNGDISTYSPEFAGSLSPAFDDFVIGNVKTTPLVDVLRSTTFHRIRAEVDEGRRRCKTECGYYALCGAAFQSNRYFENGSLRSTETTTCRLLEQTLADMFVDKLDSTSIAPDRIEAIGIRSRTSVRADTQPRRGHRYPPAA